MNDDLEQKLKKIADMLKNNDEMSESLKNFASKFNMDTGSEPDDIESDSKSVSVSNNILPDDTIKTMLKLKEVMSKVDSHNDDKVKLLYALKPFLKKSRQEKLSNCIKFLSLYKLTDYLDILDKNG